MNATVAAQMTAADVLKLRKKRGTVVWALVLALLPLLMFLVVRAIQHSSAPLVNPPAGGSAGYQDGISIVALLFGPLAAILIGVEAGAGDSAAGVFRDLVVTGRSRVALFASRVPAALAVVAAVTCISYAVLAAGTFALAGGTPTPDGATMINGLAFSLLATLVVGAVAVGFAALTASRPAALTALIGWQLVASPILASVESLGDARKALLSQALVHFSPVHVTQRGGTVAMSTGLALVVLVCWLAAFLALGAWRTSAMDA